MYLLLLLASLAASRDEMRQTGMFTNAAPAAERFEMLTTYVFEEVSICGKKTGKCGCGKRRTRQTRFWQTLNPFNKNADGTPKTRSQIYKELEAERAEWAALPITCDDCDGHQP